MVVPSTCETILPVSCSGMWQSMQRVSIACPSLGKTRQSATLWQVMQWDENEAASRCGVWTSWQVVQVIVLLKRKHRLLSRRGTCLAWTSTRVFGSALEKAMNRLRSSPGWYESDGTSGSPAPLWHRAQTSSCLARARRAGFTIANSAGAVGGLAERNRAMCSLPGPWHFSHETPRTRL